MFIVDLSTDNATMSVQPLAAIRDALLRVVAELEKGNGSGAVKDGAGRMIGSYRYDPNS